MDLWVVAAATGAGYLAKYWQNLSGEKDGSSQALYGNSFHNPSEPKNLLRQIWDQNCSSHILPGSRERQDIWDGKPTELNSSFGNDSILVVASTFGDAKGPGKGNFQEDGVGFIRRNGPLDESDDVLAEFFTTKTFIPGISVRSRRSNGYLVKPSNFLENYLTARLCRETEQAQTKEPKYGGSISPPSTPSMWPILVTDGHQICRGVTKDSFGIVISGGKNDPSRECEFNSESQEIRSVKLPQKPKKRILKQHSRVSSSKLSGGPSGVLLFFVGITIGIRSAAIANKREMGYLYKLLRHSDNLVQDLLDELEMKEMLTIKELTNEDNQSRMSFNQERLASAFGKESWEPTKYNGSSTPDDQAADKPDFMSEIGAELEAELERLEQNMREPRLERMSQFVEFYPEAEDDTFRASGGLLESDSDASQTSSDTPHTANYAVSHKELSLRLHEVIESRLEARIQELEAALKNSQQRLMAIESRHVIPERSLGHSQVGSSSSSPGSPIPVNEVIAETSP